MEISTPISWRSALEMEDLMLFQEPYDDIHQSLDEIMSQNNMDHEFMPLNMNQTQHQHQNQNQHQHHPPLSTSAVINANDVTKQPTTTAMTNTKCSKPTRKHPEVQKLTSPTQNTCFPVILNFGSSILSKEDEIHENDHEEEHVSSLVIDEEEGVFPKEDVLYGNCDRVTDEEPPAKRKYSKRSSSSTTSTKEHIMAERRRREKLSQLLAALSALVPGLKRMDKTSILSEAINHLKELHEKIKYLEEDGAKRSIESVKLVKKTYFTSVEEDCHSNSCNEYLLPTSHHRHDQLPEIETKLSKNNILIKITCEKRETSLSRILGVLEKYSLSVSTVHASPFDRTLDVTVIAQMEKEFDARLQDVLQDLSKACSKA